MAAKKRQRRKKNFWAPGPVAWRMTFGRKGPTRKAVAKGIRNKFDNWFGPQTIASIAHDPVTQKRVKKVLRVNPKTGVITPVSPAARGGKKTVASKSSRASAPSKPSRAGQVSRRTAAATAAQTTQPIQSVRKKTMPERVIQKADGKFDGSQPAVDPRIKARQEYQRIMRHVDGLNRQTDRDLGWNREA